MARAERRDGERGHRSWVARVPLPLGLPLIGIMLLTLLVDRALGLTALAVVPEATLAGGRTPGMVLSDLGAVLVSDAVTVAVVTLSLLVVRSSGRPRTRGMLFVLLTTVSLAGLQLGVVSARAVTGATLPVDLYLARALLLAGTTVAALVVLAALSEHRQSVQQLRGETAAAESLAVAGRASLEALRADVTGRVEEVLREALAVLGGGEMPGPGERLRSVADEVLRPLSHRLAVSPVPGAEVAPKVDSTRWPERWSDMSATLLRTPVVPARAIASLATGLALLRSFVTDQDTVRDLSPAIAARVADTEGVAIGLTFDALPFLIVVSELLLLFVITRWSAGRLAAHVERMRDGARPLRSWTSASSGMVGIAMLTVAVPAVVEWVAGLGTPVGVRTPLLALAGSLVPLLAVTFGVSLFAAVEGERAALQADLAHRRAETARTAARVQAVLGHEQRRLARSLHADVKAAVNAAGLMLERADRDGGVTSDVIEDAATRIATAVDRFLSGSPSPLPLSDRLSEVRDLWEGVCAVTVDIGPLASVRLDADPVARDLIVDLVTEACANAVVHGGAGSVRVRVDTADVAGDEVGGDEVIVDITDDGTQRDVPDVVNGRSQEQVAGMGTEVLRASCTSFSLDVADRGARLVAVVPLG